MGGMMGGGGGGVSIPQRNWSTEWQNIKQGDTGQINQFENFATVKEPLLQGAYKGAEGIIPALGLVGGGYSSAIANAIDTIKNKGALSPELQRMADQGALGLESGAGMANSNAGIAHALLNRENLRQDRYNTAVGQFGVLAPQAQQQELGPLQAGVDSYTKLTNPILAYLSDLNSSNQNAAAAQSVAGANASAGKASGTIGAVGSVIGGVAMAY